MVAEEVDAFGGGVELDAGQPNLACFVVIHVGPILLGNQFLKIAWAAVRSTIIDPPNASTFFTRICFEANGNLQLSRIDLLLDGRSLE